jgi:hypothetical protein
MGKKCMICGKEIEGEELKRMNAASSCFFEGQTIWIEGHKTCLRNIWDLIVIPNRRAQLEWETKFKKALRERLFSEKKKEEVRRLLETFRMVSVIFPDDVPKG